MEQAVNRLVIFVDRFTGRRYYKNTKEAANLNSLGLGYIEGQEPKEETKEVKHKKSKK